MGTHEMAAWGPWPPRTLPTWHQIGHIAGLSPDILCAVRRLPSSLYWGTIPNGHLVSRPGVASPRLGCT